MCSIRYKESINSICTRKRYLGIKKVLDKKFKNSRKGMLKKISFLFWSIGINHKQWSRQYPTRREKEIICFVMLISLKKIFFKVELEEENRLDGERTTKKLILVFN